MLGTVTSLAGSVEVWQQGQSPLPLAAPSSFKFSVCDPHSNRNPTAHPGSSVQFSSQDTWGIPPFPSEAIVRITSEL